MAYILMAVIALLAIAYIVYLILDLMSRRKFAEQYSTWEPDLDQYYRQELEREQQAKDEKICEISRRPAPKAGDDIGGRFMQIRLPAV